MGRIVQVRQGTRRWARWIQGKLETRYTIAILRMASEQADECAL